MNWLKEPLLHFLLIGAVLRRLRSTSVRLSAFGGTIALALMSYAPLAADDLTGTERFLCSAGQVTACYDDGECLTPPPWELNVPEFIEVDLGAATLSTTAASSQDRSTPIKNLEREDGFIVLQGFESGRAFSFLIAEKTGRASIAVAREGLGVSVFGACTPLTGSPERGRTEKD